MQKNKPIIFGLMGTTGLLLIYFILLGWDNSFSHAIEQFLELWYWIIILVTGFGIQLGLYSYIKLNIHRKVTAATAEVAAAGGISTGSMIACCAHHVADVLPLVGLSAAAIFLVKYQIPFILLGVFSNLVGVTIMLSIIQQHGLHQKRGFLSTIFRYKMKTVRNIAIIIAVLVVSNSFLHVYFNADESITDNESVVEFELPIKTNNKKQ